MRFHKNDHQLLSKIAQAAVGKGKKYSIEVNLRSGKCKTTGKGILTYDESKLEDIGNDLFDSHKLAEIPAGEIPAGAELDIQIIELTPYREGNGFQFEMEHAGYISLKLKEGSKRFEKVHAYALNCAPEQKIDFN